DGEAVRNLGATLTTLPSVNETVTVTVVKSSDGGTTWADLAVSCQLAGPQRAADDLVRWVVLAKGDLLALKVVSFSAVGEATGASLCPRPYLFSIETSCCRTTCSAGKRQRPTGTCQIGSFRF